MKIKLIRYNKDHDFINKRLVKNLKYLFKILVYLTLIVFSFFTGVLYSIHYIESLGSFEGLENLVFSISNYIKYLLILMILVRIIQFGVKTYYIYKEIKELKEEGNQIG